MITSLPRTDWLERERAHQARADALTAEHRERAARGEKHPVWDFLFTYYSYKPAQLRRWHPGAGIEVEQAPERLTWRWYFCLLYTSPSPRDKRQSRMPSSA